MELKKDNGIFPKVWVITAGRYTKYSFDSLGLDNLPITAREYQISAIGKYLISPLPVHIKKLLLGCEIHLKKSRIDFIKTKLFKCVGRENNGEASSFALMKGFRGFRQNLSNSALDSHIQTIADKLAVHDSFFKQLKNMDMKKVDHISGICRDDTRTDTPLTIEGSLDQQREFMLRNAGKEIGVRIQRAQIASGLFEMKGFDFRSYTEEASYRLIRFVHHGAPMACVLESDNSIAFWVDDIKSIQHLQLFEYSLRNNPHMHQMLSHCVRGRSLPLKLLFNNDLSIDYSRAPLPSLFHEMLGRQAITQDVSDILKQNLKSHQIGISLSFIDDREKGEDGELLTHISVLQNLRALEPIKGQLPQIFEAITRRATHFDDGKFYLLETIRGVNSEA